MASPEEEANAFLVQIGQWQEHLETINGKANAEIQAVHDRYADQVQYFSALITGLEKGLVKLVKKHRAEIVGEGDRADLPAGAVMCKDVERVKRIKGMLQKLKAAGLKQAIKVAAEYVNWDEVEKFSDDTLKDLGTKRVKKAVVSYELKKSTR